MRVYHLSDKRLVVDRAHGVITTDDLKVFSGVPSNTMASRHVHRLVQVRSSRLFFFSFFFYALLTNGLGFILVGARGKSSHYH